MRLLTVSTICLCGAVLAVAPVPALAQAGKREKSKPPTHTSQARQLKDCSEFGAGFRRVEGTSSCVKIGGTLRIEAGRVR